MGIVAVETRWKVYLGGIKEATDLQTAASRPREIANDVEGLADKVPGEVDISIEAYSKPHILIKREQED